MTVIRLADSFTPSGGEKAAAREKLTLIQRELPNGFSHWLGRLSPSVWPDSRFTVRIRDIRAGLFELFKECKTPLDEQAQWWIDDVAALSAQYASASGEDIVDVRLERIVRDACWKFHVDNVEVRLVTTYYGPGTELVPNEFGQDARMLQRDYDGPLLQMKAGEVAIFRGGGSGVVHRSPPIAGTGENRSVLILNTPSDSSPPRWSP
jgi:hypothetical protein